ncbi:hypothetical protein BKA70DRAFT_1536106 [Coprinopsis sp. MPI-PUGE-AT-0042]|nr:hypothetical protein BKA70DRAFT_1536106 [Coprinopsis sp. MPI-PUGE-AT-0042]
MTIKKPLNGWTAMWNVQPSTTLTETQNDSSRRVPLCTKDFAGQWWWAYEDLDGRRTFHAHQTWLQGSMTRNVARYRRTRTEARVQLMQVEVMAIGEDMGVETPRRFACDEEAIRVSAVWCTCRMDHGGWASIETEVGKDEEARLELGDAVFAGACPRHLCKIRVDARGMVTSLGSAVETGDGVAAREDSRLWKQVAESNIWYPTRSSSLDSSTRRGRNVTGAFAETGTSSGVRPCRRFVPLGKNQRAQRYDTDYQRVSVVSTYCRPYNA